MKIQLQFKLLNNRLPLDYRRLFLSFFKRALSEIAEGKYYEKYYFTPQRRNFTFAVNLPEPKFSKTEINLGKNELKLTFSTADKEMYFVFMSAFIKQKNREIPIPMNNKLKLVSIVQIKEKTAESSSALIKMLSPLCLRVHKSDGNSDRYISAANPEFSEKAGEIIQNQLILSGFDKSMASDFKIKPINAKKTVVYHYDSYIECSVGDFVIMADKAILNYLLESGIGSRKSAGFGFAKLIAEGGETG